MFYGSIRSAPLKASYNIFNSLLPPHNNGLRSWYLNGMLQRLLFDTSAHHPSCGIDGAAYDGSSYWYTTAGVMRNSPSHLMWFSRGERCDQLQKCRSNRPTPKQGSHHVSLLRLLLFLFCHLCCCGWKAILFVHQPSSTSHQLQPLLSLPLPCNIRFEAFVLSWLLNGFYRPQLHSTSCAAAFFRPFSSFYVGRSV
jgi:hypothetical protein